MCSARCTGTCGQRRHAPEHRAKAAPPKSTTIAPHIAALRPRHVGTVAGGFFHEGRGPRAAALQPKPGPKPSRKENTMSQSETDIHLIVLRLLREGYAALSAAQRRVVDSLMAVC